MASGIENTQCSIIGLSPVLTYKLGQNLVIASNGHSIIFPFVQGIESLVRILNRREVVQADFLFKAGMDGGLSNDQVKNLLHVLYSWLSFDLLPSI